MDQLSEGKICQQIQQIASVDILDLSREQLIRLHDLKEELLRRHPERIPTPQEGRY